MKRPYLIFFFLTLFAGNAAMSKPASPPTPDSLLPVRGKWRLDNLQDRDYHAALALLLPLAGPDMVFLKDSLRTRLFIDLARVAATLRLYPLAMRCYFNAIHHETQLPEDSSWYRELPAAESRPVAVDSVIAAFNDGKEAAFYALLFEVKQPIPGRRKAYTHINNVGHTFITLLKYNHDATLVSRSFGFYPRKKGILSATPFHPAAPSVVKDDSRHEWDEAVARIISYRQFHDILTVLASYDHRPYHLSHNNCTDFGLAVARMGGIDVTATDGRWPFGHGNNPGAAGQSLLEGKVGNTDDGSQQGLLLLKNPVAH